MAALCESRAERRQTMNPTNLRIACFASCSAGMRNHAALLFNIASCLEGRAVVWSQPLTGHVPSTSYMHEHWHDAKCRRVLWVSQSGGCICLRIWFFIIVFYYQDACDPCADLCWPPFGPTMTWSWYFFQQMSFGRPIFIQCQTPTQYWIKIVHPWVQKFYPVLGLVSGERLLWHFQTPVLYWINFGLRSFGVLQCFTMRSYFCPDTQVILQIAIRGWSQETSICGQRCYKCIGSRWI